MSLIPAFFMDSVVSIGIDVTVDNKCVRHCIGTGFLLAKMIDKDKGYIFLITNRHVFGENKRIFVRFNSERNPTTKDFHIDLYSPEGKKLFSEHQDPKIDIVSVKIDTNILINQKFKFGSYRINENTLSLAEMNKNGLGEGSLIYVLGFPMNLVDIAINSPICRLGCISRIRDAYASASANSYIIDSQIFPGNSGGPVINRLELTTLQGTANITTTNLIGIVHSYIPYQDSLQSVQTGRIVSTTQENSGLALVHPVDRILETVNEELKRVGIVS
ncbi:MAG: serine protease [Bacillota bacterium]